MILELVTGGESYFDEINLVDNDEYKKCLNEVDDMLEKFC